MRSVLRSFEAGGIEVYGELGVSLAIHIGRCDYRSPSLSSAAQDYRILFRLPRMATVQSAVGSVRMKVSADNGHIELLNSLLSCPAEPYLQSLSCPQRGRLPWPPASRPWPRYRVHSPELNSSPPTPDRLP